MTNENDDIQARLTVGLAEKYAVESKLGEGGMALVYLATDIKHGRKVAVKVLRPELASSLGPERFLREIQLTAALSHPHILPLYDSGEADGFLFYVMPYVEGESLDALLKREQQLTIPDAVRITREVAEALSVAHSRGLIHRDIKPDNILMTGGHAMVADFGIARAVEEAGGEKLTQTGMAVGTPAYMSPEQALGESNVDGRSDVYSLGCVLYELLVGDVPFTGPTPMAVLARHTMDNLTAPSIMRQSIPEELEDIVYCAMAKTPADRFKSAGEMAEALAALETGGLLSVRQTAAHVRQTMTHTRQTKTFAVERPWWKKAIVPTGVVAALAVGTLVGWQLLGGSSSASGAGEAGLDPRRIAVTYFEDMSSDGRLGYVADGLTEGLIDRLSAVSQFTVISKNGVSPYRGTEVTRDSIARALETGSVITGAIEPESGDRVRVTTRLIEGTSGVELSRASFVLPAQSALVVMDSVSETVSRFLRGRLGEEIRLRERRTGTSNVDAWSLVQRGERARTDATEIRNHDPDESMRQFALSDSLLALAQEADPNWAEPAIQRGWTVYYRAPLVERYEFVGELGKAIEFANQALERDSRSAEALHLRGRSRFRIWREQAGSDDPAQAKLLEDAQADLEAAVANDASLAEAWYVLSILYYDVKDNFSAARAAEKAYEADAFLGTQNNSVYQLFSTYYDLEQFPKAQQWCREGARRFGTESRFTMCQLMMMVTPLATPDVETAWSLSRRLDSIAEPLQARYGRMNVGGVLARAGLADSARSVLESARAGLDIDPDQDLAVREAIMRVLLGDHDLAVDLLTRYIVANPTHAFDLTSGDLHWNWRPLRDNPRFRTLAAETH